MEMAELAIQIKLQQRPIERPLNELVAGSGLSGSLRLGGWHMSSSAGLLETCVSRAWQDIRTAARCSFAILFEFESSWTH